jgi:pimeloyl-ACP methyl ester carboxylesterase
MSANIILPNRNIHPFAFFDSDLDSESISADKPVVLILHGLFGGLSTFTAVVDKLKHDYRVIILSLPFFDQDHLQTIPQLSRYVSRFINQILPEKSIHLIGNSLGGQIAIHLSTHYSKSIQTLILTGSAGLMENTFGCSKPKRFSLDYIKERTKDVFFSYQLEDESLTAIQNVLLDNEQCGRLIKIARNSKTTHFGNLLMEIKQPVLLIWGENDKITPPIAAQEFRKAIPNASLKWISKCGHAPMMEHPELFAHYCHSFFTKHKTETNYSSSYV